MFKVRAAEIRLAGLPGQAAALLGVLAMLGGCQGRGAIGAGEDLYHGLQGGAIAQQRPPPPGVDDPFPNLASLPPRPPAPDIIAEQRIADQLAAQRDQATSDAAAHPLTPRAPPPALPKQAPPDPNANHVVVEAAAAPVPARASPAQPAPAPSPAAAAIPTLASVPAVPAAVGSGPLPPLAAAPPPPPANLGVAVSPELAGAGQPATAAASAPPATPVATATAAAQPAPLLDRLLSQTAVPRPVGDAIYTAPVIAPVSTVAISFTPGSAELPPSANLQLRRFALAHKGVPVTITGHGEVVLPGADSQSRALDLALRRAQAIAASLAANGVAAANLRLHAEAAGRGGSAGA